MTFFLKITFAATFGKNGNNLCTSNHNWQKPDIASYQVLPPKTWSRHTRWLMTTSLSLVLHSQCLVHHAPTHPASESTGMSHGAPASNTISKWQKLRKRLPPCWWIEHVRWIPRLKEPQVFVDADHIGPLEHDLLAPDRVRNTFQHSFSTRQSLSTLTLTNAGQNPWPLIFFHYHLLNEPMAHFRVISHSHARWARVCL